MTASIDLARFCNDLTRRAIRGYPWRCKDGMCGAEDCPRCFPIQPTREPEDTSHLEPDAGEPSPNRW